VGGLASLALVFWAETTVGLGTGGAFEALTLDFQVFTSSALEALGHSSGKVNSALGAASNGGSSLVGGVIALDELDFTRLGIDDLLVDSLWLGTTSDSCVFADVTSGDASSTLGVGFLEETSLARVDSAFIGLVTASLGVGRTVDTVTGVIPELGVLTGGSLSHIGSAVTEGSVSRVD
jgi:hypothetical protein